MRLDTAGLSCRSVSEAGDKAPKYAKSLGKPGCWHAGMPQAIALFTMATRQGETLWELSADGALIPSEANRCDALALAGTGYAQGIRVILGTPEPLALPKSAILAKVAAMYADIGDEEAMSHTAHEALMWAAVGE